MSARLTALLGALAGCSACGEVGLTLELSAKNDVPALDAVRVQVSQGDQLTEQTFGLAGAPLPQSVAVVSKGLTRGSVDVVVQGLKGERVEALGRATGALQPASSGGHLALVLERLCDGGSCGCEAKGCSAAAKSCGHQADGCGGQRDCGGCASGETCAGNVCTNAPCHPKTCAELGLTCGAAPDGCGGTSSCGACDAGPCVPLVQCPQNACGPTPDGCGGALSCPVSCPLLRICSSLDGGATRCNCLPPLSECNGQCVDLSSSSSHCGACSHACPGGQSCSGGLCPCVDAGSNADGHCCPSGWVFAPPVGNSLGTASSGWRCYRGPFDAGTPAQGEAQCAQETATAFGRAAPALGAGLALSDNVAVPATACGSYLRGGTGNLVIDVESGSDMKTSTLTCSPVCLGNCSCINCSCLGNQRSCAQRYFCVMDPLGPRVEGDCKEDGECPPGRECQVAGACVDAGKGWCITDAECGTAGRCVYRGSGQTGLCQP
ncbi:MAG: hypothetical protein IPJ65_31905 [Archangiaceae bacterium]|nr:hypothetical protein [Archangiaceae bacterium]